MNFLEAAEIAKRNPGSHFSRGESGLFVVYLSDGRVVTAPHQECLSNDQSSSGDSGRLGGASQQLQALAQEVASLTQLLKTCNTEIHQLRREVNDLKKAIARIPDSEWSRYENEQKQREEQQKAEERDRIIGLAQDGRLTYQQLCLVADNANTLGLSQADYEFIRAEIAKNVPQPLSPDCFVVHAATDGQG